MNVRWWRIGVLFERDGAPWTRTLHIRAFTEESARRMAAERVGCPHTVHVIEPSEPLLRVENREEIVADFGPFRRSWEDPVLAELRADDLR